MIAVSPVILDTPPALAGEMDAHSDPCIRVAFWRCGFIESAVSQRSFQVVLFDPACDRTGIEANMVRTQNAEVKKLACEFGADVFEARMGSIREKGTEAFYAGRSCVRVKRPPSTAGYP